METDKRYAILIDADNISEKYIKIILDEIANYGVATYKRIYGDWTNPRLSKWKANLLENSILPVQQYNYTSGKNSTDSAMIIDSMDILYSGNVDGYCLVTSDSDFTRLAARLRESGMDVIGMGEKKTPRPFISACNQFKYLDVLAKAAEDENDEAEDNLGTNIPTKEDYDENDYNIIVKTLVSLVRENSDDEGWLDLGLLGNLILKRNPDFDVRNFGHKKLLSFIKNIDSFEIRSVQAPGGNNTLKYVKVKTKLGRNR